MHIAIGTQNKGKIEALKQTLLQYHAFTHAKVTSVQVASGVGHQPIGLNETIQGATNRAKAAYESGAFDLGVGLESGIFPVPHTKSGYMDTTCCAIYDGVQIHLGFSSCFEYPKTMIDAVLNEGKEISEIAVELGFAHDSSFKEDQGMIGVLTGGVVPRVLYSEQAVHMALVHILNKPHYSS